MWGRFTRVVLKVVESGARSWSVRFCWWFGYRVASTARLPTIEIEVDSVFVSGHCLVPRVLSCVVVDVVRGNLFLKEDEIGTRRFQLVNLNTNYASYLR